MCRALAASGIDTQFGPDARGCRRAHIWEDDLHLFLLGRLSPGLAAALAGHLAGCETCSEELESVRDMRNRLVALSLSNHKPDSEYKQ